MNLQLFNTLANTAIKYMSPQEDWRFMQADTYQFYNITHNSIYNANIPDWRKYKNEIFDEIRKHIGNKDALISNLILVKTTPHTIIQPIPIESGIIPIKSDGLYGAIRPYTSRNKVIRQTYLHAPWIFQWTNDDSFGFYIDEDKVLFPGGRVMNMYSMGDSIFWYFKVDNAYKINPLTSKRDTLVEKRKEQVNEF